MGIQEGLEAGVKHEKDGRELGELAAYDPGVKVRYEAAVSELEDVSLPFLDRVEDLKDAPLDRLMVAHGFRARFFMRFFFYYALEASRARARKYRMDTSSSMVVTELVVVSSPLTSSLALTVEIHGDNSSLTVVVPPVNSITVSDYPLSDVSIVRDVASNDDLQNQNSTEKAVHDDMFDTTLLDKPEDDHLSRPGSS
ncbi:hypothetical protein Tco_0194961 [Tanacetum coccineum]